MVSDRIDDDLGGGGILKEGVVALTRYYPVGFLQPEKNDEKPQSGVGANISRKSRPLPLDQAVRYIADVNSFLYGLYGYTVDMTHSHAT
jgi:hypothetical protein